MTRPWQSCGLPLCTPILASLSSLCCLPLQHTHTHLRTPTNSGSLAPSHELWLLWHGRCGGTRSTHIASITTAKLPPHCIHQPLSWLPPMHANQACKRGLGDAGPWPCRPRPLCLWLAPTHSHHLKHRAHAGAPILQTTDVKVSCSKVSSCPKGYTMKQVGEGREGGRQVTA